MTGREVGSMSATSREDAAATERGHWSDPDTATRFAHSYDESGIRFDHFPTGRSITVPQEAPMAETSPPHLSFEELGEVGLVQEVNRLLLHPIGLALARHEDGTLTVLTDPDPEGWRFGGFDLSEKAEAFATRQAEWHPRRQAALGYIVQPVTEGSDD